MAKNVKKVDPNCAAPMELADGVYALTTSGSIAYLVTGNEKALVIDTGFGKEDTYAAAKKATDLPLILVNTHGHLDHIGCNNMFDTAYCHPLERLKVGRKNIKIETVREGYVFDLGGKKMEVIEIPGHTPGSIALLDRTDKNIFVGDMIYDKNLFLQFPYSNVKDYIASMDKLLAMSDDIETVFCCHGAEIPETLEQAKKTRELAQMVLDGKAEGQPVHLETEDGPYDVKVYNYNGAGIYHA